MPDIDRNLVIKADGQILQGSFRSYIHGRECVGLYPMPYMLRLWNLEDNLYLQLSRAKKVSVEYQKQLLAYGDIADVFRYIIDEGTLSVVCFTLGLSLWESPVSMSILAGATVSETVNSILQESGTGISLLTFTGSDPVTARGQSFFGRAAEALSLSLSAANAEGYLVESGLCILPEADQPVSMLITEEDMLMDPEFPNGDLAVLRLKVAGWPIGKKIEARWKGKSFKGIVRERMIDADSGNGPWYSEILVEVRRGE